MPRQKEKKKYMMINECSGRREMLNSEKSCLVGPRRNQNFNYQLPTKPGKEREGELVKEVR